MSPPAGCRQASFVQYERGRGARGSCIGRVKIMLHYAVVFFIIALIAAVFGFGGIAAGAVGIAKVLFFVFLALAAISVIANLMRSA
jgi:uncharacterized membrane protein YtjA (UPF0391 family)